MDSCVQIWQDSAAIMRPPPLRSPDVWADSCRKLPPGSAEPGPFRSSRTPYVIPIVRACVDPLYRRVLIVMGSQMGKTDGIQLNLIGHRLDDDPVPVLYIGPTRSNVEKVIEPRAVKMFRSAKTLWAKLAKGKRSSKTYKVIAGVSLRFAWAGSATELASEPACLVLVDERDRMENDIGGEGDPVEIADARNSTYPDGKTIVTSSPGIGTVKTIVHKSGLEHWEVSEDVHSPTWKLWQEGTRHEWSWPCPECKEYFIPRFKLLVWPEGCTPNQALKEAKMTCPHCGSMIDDARKSEMNAKGVFVAPGQSVKKGKVKGNIPENESASFWVSGLCSPWRTWGQRAKAFLDATRSGDPGRIQAVINTGLGELYGVRGEAPKWSEVGDLRGGYDFDAIPEGVRVLTCGVDVQKDRLYYEVRGWGLNFESWQIRHGELWGETEHDPVWQQLAELLDTPFGRFRIRLMLIDSGYRPGDKNKVPTNQVYMFCRRFKSRVFPSKGHDTLSKPLKPSKIDVNIGGKVVKNGLQLWHVDTDYFKSWVYARLEWPVGESGAWHLSRETTDDYCQQVVSEGRAVKSSGRVVWIKHGENHYLDCAVLNVCAAHILQVHTLAPKSKACKQRRTRGMVSNGVEIYS